MWFNLLTEESCIQRAQSANFEQLQTHHQCGIHGHFESSQSQSTKTWWENKRVKIKKLRNTHLSWSHDNSDGIIFITVFQRKQWCERVCHNVYDCRILLQRKRRCREEWIKNVKMNCSDHNEKKKKRRKVIEEKWKIFWNKKKEMICENERRNQKVNTKKQLQFQLKSSSKFYLLNRFFLLQVLDLIWRLFNCSIELGFIFYFV